MGIQNFPEGAALSLPLHQEGASRCKAFLLGSLSGIVEPIFGVFTVLVSGAVAPVMPWLLSFAAGAMIYVVAVSYTHLDVYKRQLCPCPDVIDKNNTRFC